MPNLEQFKNYIFDMDGTLVDSSEEVLSCLKKACELNNAKINMQNFSSNVIGPPLREIIKSVILDSHNEDLITKITSDFRRIYDNDENDKSSLYENIYEWLVSLGKSGKKLFLATNKPTIPTKRLIKKLNLNMFEDIYTIDKYAGKHISKQEMVEEIILKYGLKKSETIMVGDAPSDVKAAHNNEISALGVLWGYGDDKTSLMEKSDFVLKNAKDVCLDHNTIKSDILSEYSEILTKDKDIYLFGAKYLGEVLLSNFQNAGYKVKGFVDNNKNLHGTTLNNLKIYSPQELVSEKDTAVIIIASVNYNNEIFEQLNSMGFKNIVPYPILTIFDEKTFHSTMPFENLIPDLIENIHEYENLMQLLKDEKSKFVLEKLIEFRKTFDFNIFPQIKEPSNKQYFEDFVPNDNDIFIDGGAFDGDTVINFLKFQNNKYKKIYFFEPDKTSIEQAKKNLAQYKNIEYHAKGISDFTKKLKFNSRGDFGSVFCEDGEIELECVALKDIVKEPKAFIKLDIEGAEIDAINGAESFFKNGSPFAICVYHKPSDIWQIPKLISNLNPNYNFYLRHYSNTVFETVLYGIQGIK